MLLAFFADSYIVQVFIVAGLFGAFAIWYTTRGLERADIRSKKFEREKQVAITHVRKNATDIEHEAY